LLDEVGTLLTALIESLDHDAREERCRLTLVS